MNNGYFLIGEIMFRSKFKISLNGTFFILSFIIIALVSKLTPTYSMEFSTLLLLIVATIVVALYPLKYGYMSRINMKHLISQLKKATS